MNEYDFSGWATRCGLRCSDGRTIMPNAFKDNDGATVPLVWNHQHNDAMNVLGHALLQNYPEGVYAYCTFNDSEQGLNAKELVRHGDVTSLSIYANQLQQRGGEVYHGAIREVSLVLAGANPGAYIDSVMVHSEDGPNEAGIIYSGDDVLELAHADSEEDEHETDRAKTVQEVYNEMTDEQQAAVNFLVAVAAETTDESEEASHSDDSSNYDTTFTYESEEDESMKHNVFDMDETYSDNTLSHAEMQATLDDAKRYGSLKDAAIAHGITDIDYLFPEPKSLNTPPDWISREMDWVQKVMNAVHHTPFSRIKSQFADITADDARAKGYIKGHLKKEEVFTLLKRTTTPTTIYKKQKLDRDDIVDITDFDVIAWIKAEMRMMLDEEIARAILIGDGRLSSSDDKINEANIRPIVSDADLYTIKKTVAYAASATDDQKARAFIKTAIKARKDYKGSGDPTLFTTEDMLTDLLLIEDTTGRIIYDSQSKLAATLRVSNIITVPVMENVTGPNGGPLLGIIVNLKDYNVGADKGGAINMFDDFDIDYNQQKYLIETRCSGALIKPYSAIALEGPVATPSSNENTEPTT